MKIVILSDSHDNLPNFKKAACWAEKNKAELLLHCGDVCRPSTLKKALEGFSGQFKVCLGNADEGFFWEEKKRENDWEGKIFNDWSSEKVGEVEFAFTHFKKRAKRLAREKNFDFIFYGHTHKPWKEKFKGSVLVNPGNVAGITYPATFAFFNVQTGRLELKMLRNL